jgi:phage-related minor tail protein
MASNRIKGLTIEIGGNTTKLTDSLKDVDKSLKDTQSQLKDVNKLLKLDPKNVDLLKQRHELLGKAVTDTKKRQEELKKALEQLKDAGNTEENRRQQDLLQRELIETTDQLDKLSKEYGNALTPQLQAVSAISGEVAEKTKGISTAAGIAAGGMLAMAYNAATTADDLLTLANTSGFSVEELQKLQYASSFVDVSMETMTGSVTKLTKNMASGSKVFEQLGISITDQNGNMRDATDVWYEALEALGNIQNETERDQVSMELFGKSAMEMAGIVDDGGAALKALGEEAEATGNILSQDAVEDAVAFNDQIDELKGKATMAFLEAGAALADTLVPALESLVDVITQVLSWFGNLDGSTQAFILTVLGLVAAISPIAGIISTITGVAAALNVAMLPMIGTIAAIVAGVAAAVAIGVALYQNWDTIKQKAGELASNIKQKFEDIRSSIHDKIEAAKQTVHDAIEKIKGFFNFSWSLPTLKMPHFKMEGSFSLMPPSVPHLSVDWYKKAMDDAYLLDGATIFGARGNTLLGGGEAGKEVILGLDKLREYAGGTMNFNVVINQQPGQSAEDLAKVVSRQIQKDIMNKKAVWQ